LELEHVEGTVTITREKDTMIPHVCADDHIGAVYGQGFANAQSRLWNMEKMRRAAKGTLSEVFGDSQLKHDIMMRSMKLT
jgi:penicillin amidase